MITITYRPIQKDKPTKTISSAKNSNISIIPKSLLLPPKKIWSYHLKIIKGKSNKDIRGVRNWMRLTMGSTNLKTCDNLVQITHLKDIFGSLLMRVEITKGKRTKRKSK